MTTLTDLKYIGYDRITKDYMASYDGNVIGFFPNYSAAEEALNDYVLGLCEQGLIDQPLAALDDTPAESDDPESVNWNSYVPTPEPGYTDIIRTSALWLLAHGIDACTICGDAHRPTQCPEVVMARLALRDPDDEPQPWPDRAVSTAPAIVRKTIVAWHRERTSCAQWLALFSAQDRQRLAAATIAYRRQFSPTELTAEWLCAAWDRAIADLYPPRPAVALRAA